MASFHLNSLTGKIDSCEAPDSCLFGGPEAHSDSIEAARASFFQKYGAPAFTLTKNLTKKLTFGSYGFEYISEDQELTQLIQLFLRGLENRSYTGSEKQKSLEHINRFMNELYLKRYEATEKAIYARGAYDRLASTLERFGVPRAPRDAEDVFIQETLEAAPLHSHYVVEFEEELRLEDELESREELVNVLKKEPRTWDPSELRLVGKALYENDPRLNGTGRGLAVKDVVDALKSYRDKLDRIDRVNEYIEKYDELPDLARNAFTIVDAEQLIETLKLFKVFPANYYERDRTFAAYHSGNDHNITPINELLERINEIYEREIRGIRHKLDKTQRYHTFMAELERRLDTRKTA